MIKCLLCLSPLSRSSLSSLKVYPLFLGTGRHEFLYVCLSVCFVIPGHWGTVILTGRERYLRDGEADILSSGARARTSPDSKVEPGWGRFWGHFHDFYALFFHDGWAL